MQLMTKALAKSLPKIGATSGQDDPIVLAKFFYSDFGWAWYAIEFDGEDEFFGLVEGFAKELGYFSLSELQTTRGRFSSSIKRDLHWEPCRLSELQ